MNAQAKSAHAQGEDHDHGHVHVVPMKVLVGVFVALLVLTWLTVAAVQIDFGVLVGEPILNLVGALAIAVVKAALVGLYFMHLRYESPFHGFVLVASFAFVALLIGVALLDAITYDPEKIPGYAPAVEQGMAGGADAGGESGDGAPAAGTEGGAGAGASEGAASSGAGEGAGAQGAQRDSGGP